MALLLSLPGYAAEADPPASVTARRGLSSEASAALKAALPKYITPKPTATPPAPASTVTDSNGTEERPDGILLLPDYFVTDDKILQLDEFEMLTPKGKIDLAMKRYPGLKVGPFAKLNGGIGLMMLQEERALDVSRRAGDLLKTTSDSKLRDALRRLQLHPSQ